MPSWVGNKTMPSNGTTSHPANQCRMASWKASTAGYATSASTSICSPTSERRNGSSKNGGPTTTPTDRTRASMGSHQPSSQHASTRGKTGTDSPYERGQIGEQVSEGASAEAESKNFVFLAAKVAARELIERDNVSAEAYPECTTEKGQRRE